MAPLVVDQSDPAVELSDTSSQTTPSRTPQSTPPRNRAASLGSSPWSADPSPLRPTFSLPFSFPMNPLSFLHPSPTNSILSPRAQTRSTTESHLTREARSMTLGCDAPATAAGPSTEQQFFPSAKDYAPLPLTLQDQSAYIKEAMCHLMSMLAFGSQGHSGSRGQAAASFQNVVPHLYQPQAKELRLRSWFSDPPTPPLCSFPLLILFRYLIDLFQFEFRRVYRSVRLPPSLPPSLSLLMDSQNSECLSIGEVRTVRNILLENKSLLCESLAQPAVDPGGGCRSNTIPQHSPGWKCDHDCSPDSAARVGSADFTRGQSSGSSSSEPSHSH
jgi:hypothetical protein